VVEVMVLMRERGACAGDTLLVVSEGSGRWQVDIPTNRYPRRVCCVAVFTAQTAGAVTAPEVERVELVARQAPRCQAATPCAQARRDGSAAQV